MSKQTAPNWCKNAVATVRGWEDPKTGELLVAKKGLLVEDAEKAPEVEQEAPVEPEKVEPSNESTEETDAQTAEQEPSKGIMGKLKEALVK